MSLETNEMRFLAGGGEMGALTRNKDWSQTPVGPVAQWPQLLRTTLSILLNTRFPMFLWWGQELICFYNDAYRPSLGDRGKHPAILGKRAHEAWPEIWDTIHPLIDQVLEGGEAIWREDQLIPIYRNGGMEDVYWTFSYSPVRDESDAVAGVLVTCHETTDKINTLKRIEESEERFRQVADSAPALIWMSGTDRLCNFFNKAWLRFTGRAMEQESGSGWLEGVHPDDLEKCVGIYSSFFDKREAFYMEYRLRRHDGTYRWLADSGAPRLTPSGDFVGYIGACMDIHEQKLFSEELEKQVRDRTWELEQKNAELLAMNKELQSFAYISSHDLQEPLRKIQTFSTRILDQEYPNLTEDGKDKFQRMQKAAKRMQTLIEDLLAYSRTNTEERKFKTINLGSIVEQVREDLQEELLEKQATVEVLNLGEVSVIPFQFRQLIYNLLSNALKFSKSTLAPHITITSEKGQGSTLGPEKLAPEREYCCIRISDNGIGFEQEYSEKIFEVFQRLHAQERYLGTGIGLAIVKKIVENHNGMIQAKGEPGQGATFTIYIPASPSKA
ncbi:hypothetical protein GCM10027275_52110 [Rhabdobacter roseus]|uniref:histidine kinase n=1 Tax=Rhabdobacter roseus TaxID=1655419 RepID=A0A840TWI0_9BACT|nr:PAS domain-containing sensor histidine kinase [Rhabdobacter roseus]MBB5287285.1 hypothetical protein [Rhabdobacter roseus]